MPQNLVAFSYDIPAQSGRISHILIHCEIGDLVTFDPFKRSEIWIACSSMHPSSENKTNNDHNIDIVQTLQVNLLEGGPFVCSMSLPDSTFEIETKSPFKSIMRNRTYRTPELLSVRTMIDIIYDD